MFYKNDLIPDVSMKLPNAIKLMIVEILAMKRDVLVRILTTCSDVQRVHALAKTKDATSCQIAKVYFFRLTTFLFVCCLVAVNSDLVVLSLLPMEFYTVRAPL